MRTLEEIQKILQSHKEELYKKFGVKRIGIFGSYSRGKQKETSDIDILVEFHRPIGFIKFIKLQEYLESLLGVKVDLVTKKALKKQIRKQILQEVKYV
ncbi:MAG: nucleotidyltransferase family protein [Thermococcus sp.]|uniref:nucleotidyltransferase family protein n=1 Tax=Thermococcus sp. TaxID=35749 RepID=UPI000F2901B7|nr:nucleotidyltransferase family protein [Thermococcus sp.]MCD6139859.1 nucleotidyltransferase family protein [Thermococcus sp.]RLF84482.1 MAG: nucleotidyltransferase [Thermococci archaeon]